MQLYILLLLLHPFEFSTCRGVMSCEMGGGFVKPTTPFRVGGSLCGLSSAPLPSSSERLQRRSCAEGDRGAMNRAPTS